MRTELIFSLDPTITLIWGFAGAIAQTFVQDILPVLMALSGAA